MNWILMVATHRHWSWVSAAPRRSAGAYGLAVSGAMTIVTPLTLSLIKSRTGREEPLAARRPVAAVHHRLAFLLANLTKLEDGGWLPLTSGLIIYWLMQTWASGRASVMARLLREQKPVRDFLDGLEARSAGAGTRAPRFSWTRRPRAFRARLLNNIKFNRVIHEQVVLLTVVTREQPRIPEAKRLTVTPVCEGIVRVVAQFGFMEKPNITEILREAEAHGVPYEPERTTYLPEPRGAACRASARICRRCGAGRSCRWRAARRSSPTTTDCRRAGSSRSVPASRSSSGDRRRRS